MNKKKIVTLVLEYEGEGLGIPLGNFDCRLVGMSARNELGENFRLLERIEALENQLLEVQSALDLQCLEELSQ